MILYLLFPVFFLSRWKSGRRRLHQPKQSGSRQPRCLCQKKKIPILSPGNANFQTHSSLHSDKINLIPYSSGLLSLQILLPRPANRNMWIWDEDYSGWGGEGSTGGMRKKGLRGEERKDAEERRGDVGFFLRDHMRKEDSETLGSALNKLGLIIHSPPLPRF